jgi:hypothetical protein
VASNKNLERFQSKALRQIVDAPWYVSNTLIRRDLHRPTVKEALRHYSLRAHPTPTRATWTQATAKTPAQRSAYKILVSLLQLVP